MSKVHLAILIFLFIAVLVPMFSPNCFGDCGGESRRARAEIDVRKLRVALEMYNLYNGIYPSNVQGLRALIEEPSGQPQPSNWSEWYASSEQRSALRKDPWNRDYKYRNPGVNDLVEVYTLGRDGEIGGWEGPDDDIVSEPLRD